MRTICLVLAGALALTACRAPAGRLAGTRPEPSASEPAAPEFSAPGPSEAAPSEPTSGPAVETTALGPGAAPGTARGPGGFVPRGSMRNFYAGARGRLWYYMNNYYWVSPSAPREDLWIKAEVAETFRDLRKWPDGAPVAGPEPKVTVEYWKVGPTGRSLRLDNHKDYCLLSDDYSAGAIVVEVTLTLGRLLVRDVRKGWRPPKKAYVLESRNYRGGGGVGEDRVRFEAIPTEAVTVWSYRIPWSTHPQRLTRSSWGRMEMPTWSCVERRAPPRSPARRVVTPASAGEPE